jgi:hypothetical protein
MIYGIYDNEHLHADWRIGEKVFDYCNTVNENRKSVTGYKTMVGMGGQ